MMRRFFLNWKTASVCLLVVCLSITFFPSISKAEEQETPDLRIGTFNIAANKKPDLEKMRVLTNDLGIEIVGLQEVDQFTNRNNFDMLAKFSESVYPFTYFSKALDLNPGGYGVAFASKLELTDTSLAFLDTTGANEPRVYQRAVIEKNGKKIAVYNTHISFETVAIRQKQFSQLKEALANDPVEYKVLMGDFNADQQKDEFFTFLDTYNLANGKEDKWFDTFNGVDSSMKNFAIDNIITSRNILVTSVKMVETALSDHNLFYIDCQLLDEMAVSKELLIAKLASAKKLEESTYSLASFVAVKKAMSDAEILINQSDATQVAVDAAAKAIDDAVLGLESSNLVLNKVVTYSGVEGGKTGGVWKHPHLVGEKAVDGSTTTRWSADKLDNQWFIADLGKVYDVSQIVLNLHAESPEYEVFISPDGLNYESVFKVTNGSQGDTINKVITMKNKQAKFIKYQQYKQWKHTNGQFYSSSIIELEAYESVPKPNQIKLDHLDFNLGTKQRKQLTYSFVPEGVDGEAIPVTWHSSDSGVAKVSDTGLVSAVSPGTAIISVSAENNTLSDDVTITVGEKIDYKLMRERWTTRLVGDDSLNLSDPEIMNYVATINSDGRELWETLDKSSDRKRLWAQLGSDTTSADYSTQFNNIKKLALAYGIKGSDLKGNPELYQDIIDALDFMVGTKKFNGSYWTGNWWDWQIGSPQPFVDTLMVIRNNLIESDYDKLTTYITAITGYAYDPGKQWPNSTSTGANRTDIGISVLGAAILVEDDEKMELVKIQIPVVFKQVTSGDGLYADGSLIQHTNHAYTGSYGNELLKGVGRIQSIILGTPWEIKDASIVNVFNTVQKGYLPLVHKGQMMSMVNGRSISRAPGTNPFTTEFAAGSETISNILLVSQFAPEVYRSEFRSAVKYWLTSAGTDYNFFEKSRDVEALMTAKEVMNDQTIQVKQPFTGMRVYGSMARAVQVNNQYAAAVSMYSKRIANYEFGNTENKHGWHTGDGALYVYSNDLTQYGEGYWPTVDPYRLAGTTIDTIPLADGAAQSKTSPQTWVGGAENGLVGSVGMSLDKSNLAIGMDLKANKSWFMLDGKIVALGSSINGTTKHSIETIVENRMLNESGSNLVTINDKIDDCQPKTKVVEARSWAHLEGSRSQTDIGYYFPNDTPLTYEKETRTGSYKDINGYFNSDTVYSKNYLKMSINHGESAVDESYAYVLLPGKTAEQTKQFASDNKLLILENTKECQAIKDQDTGVFAANIWSATGSNLEGLTIDKAASVIATTEGNLVSFAISDPTHSNGKITVTLNEDYQQIVSNDSTIQVLEDGKQLVIDTNKSAGASHHFVAKGTIDKTDLKQKVAAAKSLDSTLYTPETWTSLEKEVISSEAVLLNERVSQLEVNQQLDKLTLAIDNLKEVELDIAVESISLNVPDLIIIKKGKTLQIEPSITPENATDKKIRWTVVKPKLAEISVDGELKGTAVGMTKIQAETSNGKKASFILRVTK